MLSWHWHNGYHFVSFVMYIPGAKFEEHCFNIPNDILIQYLTGTICDIITFLIYTVPKHKYLQNEGEYSKKENAILPYFEKSFKYAAIICLLHRHFKHPL